MLRPRGIGSGGTPAVQAGRRADGHQSSRDRRGGVCAAIEGADADGAVYHADRLSGQRSPDQFTYGGSQRPFAQAHAAQQTFGCDPGGLLRWRAHDAGDGTAGGAALSADTRALAGPPLADPAREGRSRPMGQGLLLQGNRKPPAHRYRHVAGLYFQHLRETARPLAHRSGRQVPEPLNTRSPYEYGGLRPDGNRAILTAMLNRLFEIKA